MTQTIRIVGIGGNLETKIVLDRLLPSRHSSAVCGHILPGPGLRNAASDAVDLDDVLASWDVSTHTTDDINATSTRDWLLDLQPSHLLTFGWSQLFRTELLRIPTGFVVGSHPSALPYGRGRAPIPWTILEGLRESASSLFRMTPGVDDGPILKQRYFEIPRRAHAIDVYRLAAQSMAGCYLELLDDLTEDRLTEEPQDEAGATYREGRQPRDGLIDFQASAESIDRLIRATSYPYPGAFTHRTTTPITIGRSVERDVPARKGVPGQVLQVAGEDVLIQASDRPLWVSDVHDRGEEGLSAGPLRRGERLGLTLTEVWSQVRAGRHEDA